MINTRAMENKESELCLETKEFLLSQSEKHAKNHFTIRGRFVGACFIKEQIFDLFSKEHIGYPDNDGERGGQWLFPVTKLDTIRDVWLEKGFKQSIEECLNFPIDEESTLKLCILIKPMKDVAPLLPNERTPGVNDDWIEGGFTKGGLPEIVAKRMKTEEYVIFDIKSDLTEKQVSDIRYQILQLLY